MNILVTTDRNYLPHAYVMLTSLLENNGGNHIDLYYIHYDINDASISRFKRFFSKYNMAITFIKYDFSKIENLKTGFYISQAAYLRIICPNILPEKVSRILYLDPDIVIRKPLKDLYNTDLGDFFFAAVEDVDPDSERHIALNIPGKYGYFNTGVLLIDLEKFRAHCCSEQILDYAAKQSDKLLYADQCALNAVLYDKCLVLHPRWNLHSAIIAQHNDTSYPFSKKILETISEAAVIHYTGSVKPSHASCVHPLKELYWLYVKNTPYKYSAPLKYWCQSNLSKLGKLMAFLLRKTTPYAPKNAQRLLPHGLRYILRTMIS